MNTNSPLFDYDNATLLHAEGREYNITGSRIMVEHGLYENSSDAVLPYTVLEEAFENNTQIKYEATFFKSKVLGMDHIQKRRCVLEKREKTGIIE